MTDTKLNKLIQNILTKEQFKGATVSPNEQYYITDDDYFATKEDLNAKQNTLVSGTNIKTINGESVLGTGDLEIKSSSYHPPILSCMWSDHLINDIQWLRADTFSWQSGDVYVTAYNTLVEEYATGTEETEGSVTFKRTANGYKIATADMESAILNKYNANGIAWYYILDTDNKQFKLPRTKFGFEGLRDTVGNDVDESLPNITGTVDGTRGFASIATGAFKLTNQNGQVSTSGTARDYNIGFDASRSSSAYKNGAPVQERATQMYLYFYVGEYTQTAIEQTAGLTTEQLNAKVDIDSSWGFPSNRYIDLTLGASGATYTAPANGWFTISKLTGSTNQYINFVNSSAGGLSISSLLPSSSSTIRLFIPCKKGDSVVCNYSASGTTNAFRFIYAEGEQ